MDDSQSNRSDLDDSCVEFDDKYVRCSYIYNYIQNFFSGQ